MLDDTIAAISTPFGEGGIGVIRISGEAAEEIISRVFIPVGKSKLVNRRMTYGHIVESGSEKVIDEVLCVLMKGPSTYTAEDVVEVNCHGGMVPLRKTLELILSQGARLAERGEFTKRAFLNGRMDLSQAEAVIDVIRAKADVTFDVAMDQLEGVLSRRIKNIRKKLLDALVDLTVNIDYPDEDIEELTYEKLENSLTDINADIHGLIASADTGRIISEGLRVAIIGKPNVGKSSLMNSLLRESRAIVTEIPGTTRDTIEESMSIRGIPVILVDTAGIRETDDKIETIGIEKSKISFNRADLVIFMLDGSRELSAEDMQIAGFVDPAKTLVVLNKTDLESVFTAEDAAKQLPDTEIIETSMVDASGVDAIEKAIERRVYDGGIQQKESVTVTNVRHKSLLQEAESSVSDAIEMGQRHEPLEIIEIDVNNAYVSLGEITGEAVSDDILDEVFSRFCLGK